MHFTCEDDKKKKRKKVRCVCRSDGWLCPGPKRTALSATAARTGPTSIRASGRAPSAPPSASAHPTASRTRPTARATRPARRRRRRRRRSSTTGWTTWPPSPTTTTTTATATDTRPPITGRSATGPDPSVSARIGSVSKSRSLTTTTQSERTFFGGTGAVSAEAESTVYGSLRHARIISSPSSRDA